MSKQTESEARISINAAATNITDPEVLAAILTGWNGGSVNDAHLCPLCRHGGIRASKCEIQGGLDRGPCKFFLPSETDIEKFQGVIENHLLALEGQRAA
jgi:hypothetical protein